MPGPDHAYILQFEDQYELLYQQMEERLSMYVRMKNATDSNLTAFGLLGPSEVEDITGIRHGLTNWSDDPNTRRWAAKRDYEVAKMLDRQDDLAILVDIGMGYAQNAVASMKRKADKIIIDAVTGTALSGVNGTDTSSFTTTAPDEDDGTGGYEIASGGVGMTLDKMRSARTIFDVREVGLDGVTMGMREFVMVMGPKQHKQLLEQTEATSTDYLGVVIMPGGDMKTSRMPLVGGRIPHYMGFDIVLSNQLNLSSTNRRVLAWHKNAVGFARWGGMRKVTVDRLPEHHNAQGLIVQEHMGAVRIQDAGVLSILCSEA